MDFYKECLNFDLLIWTLILLGIFVTIRYHWNRRYLYYYASKIPGPFSVPFIGNGLLFLGEKNFLKTVLNLLEAYSPIFKFWLGPYLYIITSRPQDAQVVLATCLEKATCYETFGRQLAESLLGLPLPVWKEHRKLINPTFNKTLIDSFHGIFEKTAKNIVTMLDGSSGTEQNDLFEKIWNFTLASVHETLLDVNRVNTKSIKNLISWIIRIEQISIERAYSFWFYSDYIWKRSALYKEEKIIASKFDNYVTKIIDQKLELNVDKDNNKYIVKNGSFLNKMIKTLDANEQMMSREDIIPEVALMLGASSESTAVTITSVILALGMYLEIQEKAYREIVSVIQINEEMTLEDTNKLEYTECVIKETLRLAPTIPFLARFVDKDIKLGDYVLPAGCNAFIPIKEIHRNPDFWPDPLKFDPDRFLPETKKRHPCAFIPFSFGSRNCIGMKYAMMQMKCIVAHVVKTFKIKTLNYKELADLETDFHVVAPPINYKVLIERREI